MSKGRRCFKFSKPEVRADLIKIGYGEKKANARDRKGLLRTIDLVADWQRAEGAPVDLESLMKGCGMCIWSWPFTEQESDAYRLMLFSTAGTDLKLPHPGLSYDEQPQLFFDFLDIYLKTRAEYQEKYRGSNQ